MAADQLGGDRLDDPAEVEPALFFRHSGVKYDLKQEIAELVAQVRIVAALHGVGDLVGFLEGEGDDGLERLLEIPGASRPRGAQRRHDFEEAIDVARRLHVGGSALGAREEIGARTSPPRECVRARARSPRGPSACRRPACSPAGLRRDGKCPPAPARKCGRRRPCRRRRSPRSQNPWRRRTTSPCR